MPLQNVNTQLFDPAGVGRDVKMYSFWFGYFQEEVRLPALTAGKPSLSTWAYQHYGTYIRSSYG